jgi:hypothetical membrane protein
MERVQAFTNRYPWLGPLVYVLSVQYFLIQFIVAQSWPTAYSVSQHVISDLGNTACGAYAMRYVCSPLHGIMNASFIMLGVTMALGSLLIYQEFRRTWASFIGFNLMGLAGFGTILVGLFPENTVSELHAIGAFLALGFGNLSLIVLALAITQARRSFRVYTFVSGIISLVALVLFIFHTYAGLGAGGMERLVSYPQTIWLILFGAYMTFTRYRPRVRQKGTQP